MKYLYTLIVLLILTSCKKEEMDITTTDCSVTEPVNELHSKAAGLQNIMNRYTNKGIPGIAIAVWSEEGYWAGASGYSKIEDQTMMLPCNLQYSQSVAKTYLSVIILKMNEQGLIDLDAEITRYLPEKYSSKITDADKVTVRMLLNHTSGIPEYNSDPAYVSYLLQHPLHKFSTEDYLDYVDGKPLKYTPGSKYSYTNTNYELLALIADEVTGDHARYMREQIFTKLGVENTFYHEDDSYLYKPELVNSYWDRYSNGTIENCSDMQKVNVSSMIGDDGLIASPLDFVKFLKGLFEGQLLSAASMDQMLTFVKKESDPDFGYGLGIHKELYNGKVEYGHTGGGIGSGCYLGYFPESNAYFFIAINIGTSINSPILERSENMVNEVLDVVSE